MARRLLVPLDGSTLAEHAVPYAAVLARTFRARLTLFHAQGSEAPSDERPPNLDGLADRLRADGIDVNTHVDLLSSPGETDALILRAAANVDADVIVMATHGRSGLGRLIYGSVAEQIIRRTTLPVVLIPPTSERPWGNDGPTRVLVPLDGSELAESIFAPLEEVVRTPKTELILLRVAETIEVRLHGDECVRCRMARARGEEPDIEQVRAQRYVDGIADRFRTSGIMVESLMEVGGVPSTISRVAGERDVDLIAMATHGRGGLARLVLGSTAGETLRRAPVPVLLARPEAMQDFGVDSSEATGALAEQPASATAKDIMSQPVVTVGGGATLEEVARLMLDRRIGGAPVVDASGQLIGVITESDFTGEEHYVSFTSFKHPKLFDRWMPRSGVEAIYETARTMKVRDIMTTPVITAVEDEPVSSLIRRMVEHDIGRLPVMRGESLVGMVTRHDLLRLLVTENAGR